MLNFITFFFLSISGAHEIYKMSIMFTKTKLKQNYLNYANSCSLINVYYFMYVMITSFLIQSTGVTIYLYMINLLPICLYLCGFIKNSKFYFFFASISILCAQLGTSNNIISYIIITEIFSIITFLVLFFETSTYKSKRTNIVYFLLNNIITTTIAIVAILYLLNCVGSTNIYIFKHYLNTMQPTVLIFIFFTYVLFKYGQGPAILFKFKFYKGASINNIVFYLLVYLMFIWPLINIIVIELSCQQQQIIQNLFVVIITLCVMNSIALYSSFLDFIVFSTWVFIWYQFFFLLFACLIF